MINFFRHLNELTMSNRRSTTKSTNAKLPSPINRLLNANTFISSLTSSSQLQQQQAAPLSPSSSLTNASSLNFERVDKKLFEKAYKLIDKLLKLCQNEKLNLINSPPYIIDILPDIYSYLEQISKAYENKMHILNEIEYFLIYLNNVIQKCEQCIRLFRDAGRKIFEETSEERNTLIKYSLKYSHMLAELKSLFPSPNHVYDGQNFRIAKADAAEFWKTNFSER